MAQAKQGEVHAFNVVLDVACRTGDIVFRGPIPSVSILSSGTGTVYVSGVTKSVDVSLSGIGNAVIDAASGAFPALPLSCPCCQ